jgi:hypothetical protein
MAVEAMIIAASAEISLFVMICADAGMASAQAVIASATRDKYADIEILP